MSDTALGQLLKKDQETRDQRIFEHMIEGFIREWAPTDPRDKADFEMQLHSIIRQTFRDAQEPVLDRLMKIAMATPMPIRFMTKE